MALTAEQQAQLDALQAEAAKPEPRTTSGVAGVLHLLADVASGAVAHVGADVWAEAHSAIEKALGEPEAEAPAEAAPEAPPAESSPGFAG